MAKTKIWNIEIEGQQHEITYKYNAWSGRIVLYIDGEEMVIKRKWKQTFTGVDAPILVGGKELRFVSYGKKADIAMDGIYIDSNKEYIPIGKIPWWSWIFIVLTLAVPVVSGGGALPVFIGFGGAILCGRLSVKPQMKTLPKILVCIGITFIAWLLLGLLILAVSLAR